MTDSRAGQTPLRVVGMLSAISFLGYPLRTNITVAARQMMPDLGLTQVQMGNVFSSFQLFYALAQVPAGLLGDRWGARRVLTLALVVWAVSSFGTGLVPAAAGTAVALGLLYLARAILGIGEAATYPVGAMAIQRHVPPAYRARANGVFISSAALGSALTPPLIAAGMVTVGWRVTFLVAGVLALLMAVAWHRASPEPPPAPAPGRGNAAGLLRRSIALLRDRDLLLLSLSYFCSSAVWFLFVYWFYLYLTDVRGFTMLRGGVFGAMPYLAAALIGPLGGVLTDVLSRRGRRGRARRTAAVIGLLGSAACVVIGAQLDHPYLAIFALSLSSGLINFVEGPFWTTAAELGGDQAGLAGGVLNTFGNLGGVFSTFAVPRMVEAWGWAPSIAAFGAVAAGSAALWFAITPERAPVAPSSG